MALPYKSILCPIDFDQNSLAALDAAAELARNSDATVFVLHVVPMIIQPTGMPVYVDIYKSQEEVAWARLRDLARKNLAGIKYELMVQMGDPAGAILQTERKVRPDLIVMATHGRRGFSRFFLGSVAEMVLREAHAPVLTVRPQISDKHMVGTWMTHDPVVAHRDDKLCAVEEHMREGHFRSMPVISDGKLIGIITDRDLRVHAGFHDHTFVKDAMHEDLVTVTPSSSIREAARILRERKIGGLPVVEDGTLVGVLTVSDVLEALSEADSE